MLGFIAWVKGFKGSARSQPLEDARARRTELLHPLQQAIARQAKRDIGERFIPARDATNAVLRLEVGR